jgi:gag-polyprotein putative aspartyl protease
MSASVTKRYDSLASHLEIDVVITNPIAGRTFSCKALWDTGAERSMISKSAADELHLQILGIAWIEGFHGEDFRSFHDVNIGVAKGIGFEKVRVVSAHSLAGRHVLLGMDIITKLDFYISNVGEITVHTIRYPSVETIDFQGPSQH